MLSGIGDPATLQNGHRAATRAAGRRSQPAGITFCLSRRACRSAPGFPSIPAIGRTPDWIRSTCGRNGRAQRRLGLQQHIESCLVFKTLTSSKRLRICNASLRPNTSSFDLQLPVAFRVKCRNFVALLHASRSEFGGRVTLRSNDPADDSLSLRIILYSYSLETRGIHRQHSKLSQSAVAAGAR